MTQRTASRDARLRIEAELSTARARLARLDRPQAGDGHGDNGDVSQQQDDLDLNSAAHHILATRITQLERALEQVSAGTYGVCADCGGKIGTKRLAAVPGVQTCVACQGIREQGARSDSERRTND